MFRITDDFLNVGTEDDFYTMYFFFCDVLQFN